MQRCNCCLSSQLLSRGCACNEPSRTVASLKGACCMILLVLCIVLAIGFTVGFNVISRLSLSKTKHEYAYTILWQVSFGLLSLLFLPFDRVSIVLNPRVLLLFALSVGLWALVDAFLFSAFKYEEASTLSAIFPLNIVFTFVVSVVFFKAGSLSAWQCPARRGLIGN